MSSIVVEDKDQVRSIRFARPEKKNALTLAMYDTWTQALAEARTREDIRVVEICGEGGVFTAGNDLFDFMQNPPTGEDSSVFRLLVELRSFPKPIVAAVEGPAIGIGTTMLLHCDVVIAADTAKFQLPFVNLALVPEAAASVLLPAAVGLARASEWLFTGEPFTAAEAHAAGLISRVVSAGDLATEARKTSLLIASKPVGALLLTKKLVREPLADLVAKTMTREGALFIERLASDEARATFAAFFSKKK